MLVVWRGGGGGGYIDVTLLTNTISALICICAFSRLGCVVGGVSVRVGLYETAFYGVEMCGDSV